MKKLFLIFIFFLFLNQCGYQKIYSNNNLNFSIKSIKKENNIINNELTDALLEIFSDRNSDNTIELEIQSNKSKKIKSKDSKGDASVYVLKLETKVIAINELNKKFTNIFYKEMNYNNNDDKFELSQYENEIEKILIKQTVGEIISFLTDIR